MIHSVIFLLEKKARIYKLKLLQIVSVSQQIIKNYVQTMDEFYLMVEFLERKNKTVREMYKESLSTVTFMIKSFSFCCYGFTCVLPVHLSCLQRIRLKRVPRLQWADFFASFYSLWGGLGVCAAETRFLSVLLFHRFATVTITNEWTHRNEAPQ